MTQKIFKIENFKLSAFRSLIAQSLIVNKQLMLEFGSDFIRSCSYTATNSCLKLWVCPTKDLIHSSEAELEEPKLNIPTFDMFILRGDSFSKFLTVYNCDTIDIEFTLVPSTKSSKMVASSMKFIGKIDSGNELVTEFRMTTEEMITNRIDDYQKVIEHCTPTSDMHSVALSDSQIQEIKRLIKKLHKSNSENTSYLTFTVKPTEHSIVVNDSVFRISFDIPEELRFDSEEFSFNILKSDFIISGNQAFTIYTNATDKRVIFGANHVNAIIWCMLTKVSEVDDFTASISESTLDELDLDILDGLD